MPVVDEPIGSLVAQIQEEDAELDRLVSSPRRLLAFRTFAFIRVGLLLGELLVDEDVERGAEDETWIERLLADPEHRAAVVHEVRAVAAEIAADPATPLLGILDPRTDPRIDFVGGVRGTAALEELVRSGSAAVAFSLHPVSVADLMAICDAGGIMPPKSTWFEPKLRDGLLIHLI